LNSGLLACKAGTLLLEHLQSILLWLFCRWCLENHLPRLPSNYTPPDLDLPSSWDYRRELSGPVFHFFYVCVGALLLVYHRWSSCPFHYHVIFIPWGSLCSEVPLSNVHIASQPCYDAVSVAHPPASLRHASWPGAVFCLRPGCFGCYM
jgi:hypothetical protein